MVGEIFVGGGAGKEWDGRLAALFALFAGPHIEPRRHRACDTTGKSGRHGCEIGHGLAVVMGSQVLVVCCVRSARPGASTKEH